MYRELREGDVIIFYSKSGSGSFVNVKDKGNYFVPSKKGFKLEGQKKPVSKWEKFVYVGNEVLRSDIPRIVKMSLVRVSTGESCFISEDDMLSYFKYSPEQDLSSFKTSSKELTSEN